MHQRYFIGITLPEDLSRQISAVQHDLFIPGKVREPLTPHITLLQPDLLESSPPSYLVPKVERATDAKLPIIVSLGKAALFDQRVLYVAVHSPELYELHEELVKLLPDRVRAMYDISREFVPHVTLAQAKPKQELPPELVNNFKARVDPLLPYSFAAPNLSQFTRIRPRVYEVRKI